jgi:hypothetical protein
MKPKLDKFYTNKNYAKECIEKVLDKYDNFDYILEPSAGNGSFLDQLPEHSIGIDIEPEKSKIIKQDFFKHVIPQENKNALVIGNPPFGRVCSTAVKFFNHSASFKNVNVIAFIVPRTFRKASVQNKLNPMFHLISDSETTMKPCCFYPSLQVKCCFMIWERMNFPRVLEKLPLKHDDWKFLMYGPKDIKNQPTVPEGADFAIRAYGGKIGEIEKNTALLCPKSWHWVKSNIDVDTLIERLKVLDYSGSLNTARQNSMGKAELVKLYSKV